MIIQVNTRIARMSPTVTLVDHVWEGGSNGRRAIERAPEPLGARQEHVEEREEGEGDAESGGAPGGTLEQRAPLVLASAAPAAVQAA